MILCSHSSYLLKWQWCSVMFPLNLPNERPVCPLLELKKVKFNRSSHIHVVNIDKIGSCLSVSLGGPEGLIVLNWPQIMKPTFIKLDWR